MDFALPRRWPSAPACSLSSLERATASNNSLHETERHHRGCVPREEARQIHRCKNNHRDQQHIEPTNAFREPSEKEGTKDLADVSHGYDCADLPWCEVPFAR